MLHKFADASEMICLRFVSSLRPIGPDPDPARMAACLVSYNGKVEGTARLPRL